MVDLRQIKTFQLSTALNTSLSRIAFQFVDGGGYVADNLPNDRYVAAVATLQASPVAYLGHNPGTNMSFISSAPDAPGLGQSNGL